MTVAFLHTAFILHWPARLLHARAAFAEHGAEVVVLEVSGADSTYGFAVAPEISGAWHRLLPGRDARSLRPRFVARVIWDALEAVQPDVVFATAIAFPTGATAVRWARSRRRSVVIMDDARTEDVPRSALTNAVKRRVYANVDAVMTAGPSHNESYVWWGVPESRIFHGTQAIDVAWYAEQALAIRNGQDIPSLPRHPGTGYILGLGRSIPQKNWRVLLRAYALLHQRNNVRVPPLALVGDGPDKARLQSLANALQVPGIHFFGACSPQQVPWYYAFASAVVLPSRGEAWGLVVNEAMACGVPPVVSRQCGSADSLVLHGVNGWTFDADDVEQLYHVLTGVIRMTAEERSSVEKAARRTVAAWSLDTFTQGALHAYIAVRGSGRAARSVVDRALLASWKGRYRPI